MKLVISKLSMSSAADGLGDHCEVELFLGPSRWFMLAKNTATLYEILDFSEMTVQKCILTITAELRYLSSYESQLLSECKYL